jgi:predicted permease
LIVGEVALVVVLLGGAGLLLRSYVKVERVQTGFSASTVSMDVQVDAKYRTAEQIAAFYRALLGKVQEIPGVSSAGLINALPLSHSENVSGFLVEGFANQKEQLVSDRYITPKYFDAMDIPVVEGRTFNDGDTANRPFVVMINQAFAKKYFGGRDPVGMRMKTAGPGLPWRTVVGVVQSVQEESLEAALPPEVYEPILQTANDTDGGASLVVRSALPTDEVIAAMRDALRAVDPDLAFGNVQTMGELVTRATAERRFQTTLLTAFAAMALLLGVVGIYGLLAYSVKQRTAEIGLRMALGASRVNVVRLVLFEGLRLAVMGLSIGLAVCLAMGRVLAASLYGVSVHDRVTLAAVPALLLGFTVVACVMPAYRAAGIDPGTALRYE